MTKEKVNSIHYLRGIAALMVVFYHLKARLNDVYAQENLGDLLFNSGAFGVDLFFVISGFIICYATDRKDKNMAAKYLVSRFFRIYPLLWLSVIITFFTISVEPTIYSLLRSLVPLNANYSAGSPFFGYNLLGPAWTLTYEISFYMIFLMSFIISHKYRWLISSCVIAILVFGIQEWQSGSVTILVYNNNSFADGSFLHAPLTFLSSPIFIDFIYGILIFKIYSIVKKIKVSNNASYLLGVLSVFVFLITSILILSTQVYGHGPTLWGACSAVLVLSALTFEIFGKIKENKVLNTLGDMSYSIYLTHAIVIEILCNNDYFFNLFNFGKGVSSVIYLLTVSLFVAYASFRLIETPCILLGRKVNRLIDGK
ncbi:TPA: acyltransferase family protein [Escherichia coli]